MGDKRSPELSRWVASDKWQVASGKWQVNWVQMYKGLTSPESTLTIHIVAFVIFISKNS